MQGFPAIFPAETPNGTNPEPTPMQKERGARQSAACSLLFGSLIAAGLGLALAAGQSPENTAVKVSVAPATHRVFTTSLEVLGEAEAIRHSRPSAEVEGLVEEVLVDEGFDVKAGEVLLRLNADQRRIQKRRAEADLRLVQEQLREYRAGSRPEEIRQAEEAMYSAKALQEEARRDLERIQSLYEKSAASQQEFTAARAAADAAEHTYQEKMAAFELAKKGPRDEMIARAEALVASRQADLDAITDDIQRTEIRAPYAGVITEKLVDSGDYLAKGTPAFAVVQVHPIHVNLATPEDAVARIRRDMEIEIHIDAIPGQTFEGRVEAIVPLADQLARTFPVKVRVANEEGRILPGMAARADIPLPSPEASLAVPSDAIVRTEVGFVVYTVRNGRAALVPVAPGLSEDGLVEVRGELAEEESVVIRGNERLRPGVPVEIVPAGPPAGRPSAEQAESEGQEGGRG